LTTVDDDCHPAWMAEATSVETFLGGVHDAGRRQDAVALCALMEDVTGEPPAMWGSSIIGFGRARYRHATGREGDTPLVSFSPRARELVVYLTDDLEALQHLLDDLGPHRAGRGCLYLKRLSDVDHDALRAVVEQTVRARRDADPAHQAG
jgi:hypothetical protein